MKIKEGYNDEELKIRIVGRKDNRNAELWIEQTGLPGNGNRETLSYMSINELLDLKKEIDEALQEITR